MTDQQFTSLRAALDDEVKAKQQSALDTTLLKVEQDRLVDEIRGIQVRLEASTGQLDEWR